MRNPDALQPRPVPTYTTSTVLYSYEKDTLLSGASHLRMLGWPVHMMPAAVFDDCLLRDLGGDAFSVPICALVHGACALNSKAVWWRRTNNSGVGAAAEALVAGTVHKRQRHS